MRNPQEVAVLVHRERRLLIARRTPQGYWHVVAGVVERGETYLAAALRELHEETGLEGRALDQLGRQSYAVPEDLRPDYAPDVEGVIVESFAVEAPRGWEPVLNEEHDGYRWCDLAEAAALLHWPEAREAVASLGARLGWSA